MSSGTSSGKRLALGFLRSRLSRGELRPADSLEPDAESSDLEGRLEALEHELKLLQKRSREETPGKRVQQLATTERLWRKHLLEHVRGLAPYMAVNIQGTLYFFDSSDPKSGRTLFIKQNVRNDQDQLIRAVKILDDAGRPVVRDIFLDVGAHIGTTTLYAVRHLGFAEAVAVEPSFENARLLRISVLANGLEGVVRTVQVAVSNEIGVSDLDVSGVGSEYHHLASPLTNAHLRQPVRTTTLDALVSEGVFDPERVGLLWMDIEGHELHALEGASALLERRVPLTMELCREKLERAGNLGGLRDLLCAHYRHVLDLRKSPQDSRVLPISDIEQLIDDYGGHCVDVLVW